MQIPDSSEIKENEELINEISPNSHQNLSVLQWIEIQEPRLLYP